MKKLTGSRSTSGGERGDDRPLSLQAKIKQLLLGIQLYALGRRHTEDQKIIIINTSQVHCCCKGEFSVTLTQLVCGNQCSPDGNGFISLPQAL